MKAENKTRSILIITLAMAQCYALTGCARTAMLDSAKKALVQKAAADKLKAKQPGLPGQPTAAPSSSPSPSPSPSVVPSPNPADAAPNDSAFAASLAAVDLDVDSKTGTARLSFTQTTSAASSTIGPMVAKLSAASAPTGVDMDAPPGVLGYAAHLSCKTADCSSATLALAKLQAPLAGKTAAQIDRFALTHQTFQSTGTPKGTDADIISAFNSQGKIDITSTLTKIENSVTFFKVDSRFPNGAIVPGQPAGDAGRRIIVRGTLGDGVAISVTYIDTDSDVAAGSLSASKGKATYTEDGKAIHVELGTSGSDGIQSFDFGAPSI